MQYLQFKIFGERVRHGISMRKGGVSEGHLASLNLGLDVGDKEVNLCENYKRFCEMVGVPMDRLVVALQEHSDKILTVDGAELYAAVVGLDDRLAVARRPTSGLTLPKPISGVDGFITNTPGLPLMVRFADCQVVFIFDPIKRVIAAVHCGWRGNVKNIIGKAVKRMIDEFGCNSADILVGISPSLGPCCAEFSDPGTELPGFMQKYVNGRHVDFWQCTFEQLVDVGVLPEHIEMAQRCTVCENDKFFSYRGGQKRTGHMGGVIML